MRFETNFLGASTGILPECTFDSPFTVEPVLKIILPEEADLDNQLFEDTLRPGFTLAGIRADGGQHLSTSGVFVRSVNGGIYVTCAAHGLPTRPNCTYAGINRYLIDIVGVGSWLCPDHVQREKQFG